MESTPWTCSALCLHQLSQPPCQSWHRDSGRHHWYGFDPGGTDGGRGGIKSPGADKHRIRLRLLVTSPTRSEPGAVGSAHPGVTWVPLL